VVARDSEENPGLVGVCETSPEYVLGVNHKGVKSCIPLVISNT